MSTFKISGLEYFAFSGEEGHINQPLSMCLVGQGPIPKGKYYIVDRPDHGWKYRLRDQFTGHSEWFALYANDTVINDELWCDDVIRGQFRLHPKAGRGISQGCITIERYADFQTISALLKGAAKSSITGTNLLAYGQVEVT